MKTITILPILFLTFAQAVVQANLTFGPIRQCEPVTVSFQSNSLPAGTSADLSTTSLTILPLGLPPVVFPFTPRLTGTANSLVLAALPFPAQTRFLASLTDQLGKPLSKVSALMTIGASTSGGNTTCLVARPTERMFALLENPAQCSDFTVWYNTSTSSTSATSSTSTTTTTSSSTTATATSTGDARRPDPPRVRVYTPEGVELLLNNTSNNVTGEDGMARYTMSITAGQKVILMYDSGNGVREVTDLITVSGSSTSPSECLQAERDALAALSPSSDPNTVTRPSNAIIIGAASGGAAVLIIALAMTFFIVRDRRQRAAQQERRERVIRRVRSMSFSGQGSGRGMRGNTFLFPRPVRSSTFPGPNQAWGNDTQEEKVEESGSQNEPAAKGLSKQPSYSNHPYAFSPRSSRSSYILVDRPPSPSNPYDSSQQLPLERDASYQSRPSLGAQSEERNIPPIRFSRHGYGYEDPDRLSLTSLDIEGMLNMAQVQEDSGRSREGSIPTIMPDRRPGLEESRTSSENVVPKVPSAEVSITLPVDESNNASGSTVAFGRPTAIKLPAHPEPPLLRTRSRRTLKVNSDIPDGVFSATNSFISSAGDELGTGNDSDSMAGWSPVYPSTYFRSSAYPTQPVSPDLEEGPNQIPSSSAPAPSESTSGLPSEASSFTKRIMAPFPETRSTPTSQSQPALASSFSVLPQRTSSPPPTISSRKASTESSASMQNVTLRGSMRDSTASGYAFPSPSAFPSPPSSIPTVQYPYRPPLQSAGSSSTFRSLPSVTTSFSQPSAATTSSFGQQSAAVSSGVTYTTGASTYAPSPSEGGVFGPGSVPTLPAYSPLRDPPPFSALSPPSDSVLSSMWSGRPMLSPLVESEPSPSPVSGSSSIQTGLRSLSPLVTSGLGKQGSIRSSQLSMSPASVRLAARGDVRDVRVDASERDMKRDIGTRKTPGGSLPVNYSGLPANPRGNMRRGGSVSTVMGANETLSRQPSTIGEEFYGIAR